VNIVVLIVVSVATRQRETTAQISMVPAEAAVRTSGRGAE
jgi:hypothetical protein